MREKIKKYWWIIFITLIIGAFYLGKVNGNPNKKFEYGKTGLPKNCRAIIAKNIQMWKDSVYSAEGILDSIDRNCGAEGYSW